MSVAIELWRLARWVETVFQAQLLRGRQRPDLVSQRAVTTDGFPDPSDLSLKHGRIDRLHPAVTPWRGPGIQADQGRNAGRRTVKTRPWPILGSLDQSRTKRIPFDVPQYHSEVSILLDGKGLEPALPDVSAGMVMPLVAPDMMARSGIRRIETNALQNSRLSGFAPGLAPSRGCGFRKVWSERTHARSHSLSRK